MSDPLWTICIPTLASRREFLAGLLGNLLPQAERHGKVEVLALHNNGELPLSRYRNQLLASAKGKYVSFVDDDDLVSSDFVSACTSAMAADPDFVAFAFAYQSSRERRDCVTGLNYSGWYDTGDKLVRDVTHLNPARRTLAHRCSFGLDSSNGEDVAYVAELRPLLKTQQVIDRVLYIYRYSPANSAQATLPPHTYDPPLEIDSPAFRYLEEVNG